jgi:CheY-like chemotaxis protein
VANEILDFARMEAGTFQLSSAPFSIREILRSAVNIADPLAEQRKLMLRLHLDAALPSRVQGDSARLLQVVFNLIENAIKFTTSGSVLVTALQQSRTGDSATLRISVADTGIGIAPERLNDLFEPLAKPAASLDRRSRTCGFGLSICQRIINMMGGTMEVQSRPGIGSTFAFSLTFQTLPNESTIIKPDLHPAPQRRLQILVADDNAASRMLATVLLQGAGHHVMEATTGLEALKQFMTSSFDLVLMDVEMPDLNGIEATKAIRATEPRDRSTPIYALTAHAAESDQARCLEAGMTGFLSKPLAVETLLKLASSIGMALPPDTKATFEAGPSAQTSRPASIPLDSVHLLRPGTAAPSPHPQVPAMPATWLQEANSDM